LGELANVQGVFKIDDQIVSDFGSKVPVLPGETLETITNAVKKRDIFVGGDPDDVAVQMAQERRGSHDIARSAEFKN
jgi:hypothetical protein